MSLISSASLWNSETSQTRKRTPTMKRSTAKIRPFANDNHHQNYDNKEGFVESMEDLQKRSEDNSNHVKRLIDQLAEDNEGESLANYEPIDKPHMSTNRANNHVSIEDPAELMPKYSNRQQNADFSYNDNHLGNLATYNDSYGNTSPVAANVPYYAKMGIGNKGDSQTKLLEKINYMIHLLEQQEREKTDNVTEEFILYTFLGVFIIFVVDKFSRNSKYTR